MWREGDISIVMFEYFFPPSFCLWREKETIHGVFLWSEERCGETNSI